MNKTITKAAWGKMKPFAAATKTTGTVKMDDHGNLWEWRCSGKRVGVKSIRVAQIPDEAFTE